MRWARLLLSVFATALLGLSVVPAQAASPTKSTVTYDVTLTGLGSADARRDRYVGRATKLNGYNRTLLYEGRNFTQGWSDFTCEGSWWGRLTLIDRDGSRMVLEGGSWNSDSIIGGVSSPCGFYQRRVGHLDVVRTTGRFAGYVGTASVKLESLSGRHRLTGRLVIELTR